jgi:hypothetical protein
VNLGIAKPALAVSVMNTVFIDLKLEMMLFFSNMNERKQSLPFCAVNTLTLDVRVWSRGCGVAWDAPATSAERRVRYNTENLPFLRAEQLGRYNSGRNSFSAIVSQWGRSDGGRKPLKNFAAFGPRTDRRGRLTDMLLHFRFGTLKDRVEQWESA